MINKGYTSEDFNVIREHGPNGEPISFVMHMCARPRMYVGNPIGGDDENLYEMIMLFLRGYDYGLLNRGLHLGGKYIFTSEFHAFVTGHGPEGPISRMWEDFIKDKAKEQGVDPLKLFSKTWYRYVTMSPLERIAACGE